MNEINIELNQMDESFGMDKSNIVISMIRKQVEMEARIKELKKEMEQEFEILKKQIGTYSEDNDLKILDILSRLDDQEEELEIYKASLHTLVKNVTDIQQDLGVMNVSLLAVSKSLETIDNGQKEVSEKQDTSIAIQDKFITNLWKAVFTLIAAITAIFTGGYFLN